MLGSTPALRLSPATAAASLRAAWPRVVAAFESSWVAYPLLFLLQLKIVWGVWAVRDVSTGDTVCYFTKAWWWYTGGAMDIAWSPLYTTFYGSFLFINSDPVWATFAHRVVIVLAAAMLVLAVLRQLLPAGIAWACAAWWAVLPIVFNTLYEVHLFAALPVLTSWLLILTATGPWRRAAALGVFAASAVLVRNEMSVSTCVLGLVLAVYEWRRVRRGEGTRAAGTLLTYATALTAVVALSSAVYATSVFKYPRLAPYMKAKHTLNMAQVYAYGYQQRHPEWTRSPWTDCLGLMEETFGKREPTLREMIAANPRAVAEHFAWNASLTPNGLQLLLFYRMAGSVTPDYDNAAVSRLNSRLAWAETAGLLALWGVGGFALWRVRREWWRDCPTARALGWAAMFAAAAVVPLVILTQRPRPSYLFAFAVVLIAVSGLCLHAASTRWRLAERLRSAAPVFAVLLVLLMPRFYAKSSHAARPVADAVERLLPYRDAIHAPDTVTMYPNRENVGWYIHPLSRKPVNRQVTQVFGEVAASARPGEPFARLLERHGIHFAYLNEDSLAWLAGRNTDEATAFLDGRGAPGWELLAAGNTPGDRWRLYHRAR